MKRKCKKETQRVDNVVNIKDIIIPQDFAKTSTSYNKIRWAKEYYERNGHFDKPIVVIAETNENNKPNKLLLVDGYARYQAAKVLELTKVEVTYIDIDTYCNIKNI